jgi:hypothetical protein
LTTPFDAVRGGLPLSPEIDWQAPAADDPALLERLPGALVSVIDPAGGFRRFEGGLHVRGACREPRWSSLRAAWLGPDPLSGWFPAIEGDDIPFAQTALGDQWLLRDHAVLRLDARTGRIDDPGVSLGGWWRAIEDDPVGFLGLEPLVAYRRAGGRLAPGELLVGEAGGGRPVPVDAALRALAGKDG